MPNWCDFSAVVHGEKKEIDIFYQRCLDAQRKSAISQNWWTFELCLEHGYKKEEVMSNSFRYVGGSLDQIDAPVFNGKDWHIYIYMTTRWSPMVDGFNKLLSNYISLKGVYCAEEPGCEIYVNTDTEGRFFSVKYCIYDDDDGSEYFDSDSEFIKYMKDTYKKDIPLISDLKDDDDIKVKRGKSIRFHRFVAY